MYIPMFVAMSVLVYSSIMRFATMLCWLTQHKRMLYATDVYTAFTVVLF
jgi:hypothetical protein